MSTRDDRLRQFFAGYFNQDWDIGGAQSWRDVISQYVKENPRDQVFRAIADLRSWLGEDKSAERTLPAAFGCDYDPLAEGLSDTAWVEQLANLLEKQLTN